MDSGGNTGYPVKIKEESTPSKQVALGKKAKKTPDSQKKRNLVRWNDDVDKQVLLTLQWACNEVGIKPPWDLVAQTMGGGLTSGAIIQHLAKLRGKMLQAKISVPPKLGRGTVAKEPSKIYGTNNGKKLPPPVFAAPSTPIQATPKSKPKSKGKGKRARDEVDSDEDIDDYPEDDDDDYGTFKKKSRTSRARPKASASKTGDRKSKRRQADLAAANEEINDDILRTIEDDDGGPASRTRHIKQDFSKMDEPYSDVEEAEEEEEDEEEEEEGGGEEEGVADKFETPQMRSPTSIKEEGPVSPRTTVPRNSNNNLKVAQWSEDVTASMPPTFSFPVTAGHGVGAYRRPVSTNGMGLHTPQPSRNASTTTLTASLANRSGLNFLDTPEHTMAYGGFLTNTNGIQDLVAPVQFRGFGNHTSTVNQGVDNLAFNLNDEVFDVNAPFPSAALEPSHEDADGFGLGLDSMMFGDSFSWGQS